MKILLSALVLLISVESQAERISKRYSFIHHETHARIKLTKIDQENQTAQYYDQNDGKIRTISLSEVSQETFEPVDGVKTGNMVLVKFEKNVLKPCEVWYLYTNGLAQVGCQTGKYSKPAPIARPELAEYTVTTDAMVKEATSLEGFKKKDKVTLMADVGDLKKGDRVRIEHLFKNGTAMIQKMGLNLVDTSGLLLKYKVQVVELKDLTFNK